MALLHFKTDKYQRNSTFLQDAEYGRALDTFVKGAQAWLQLFNIILTGSGHARLSRESGAQAVWTYCSLVKITRYDCLCLCCGGLSLCCPPSNGMLQAHLTNPSPQVLLLKRRIHPQPDWWFIGALLSWSPEANSLCLTDNLVRLSASSVLCRWPHAGKCALTACCCADLQQLANVSAHALQAGDTPLDTAVATVRRETKLELPRECFSFVCLASYLWQYRQQEPQGAALGRRFARSSLHWC